MVSLAVTTLYALTPGFKMIRTRDPRQAPLIDPWGIYSIPQKFFPLIPSPPGRGEGQGEGGEEKTFGNRY
jgi:hypothetical protein